MLLEWDAALVPEGGCEVVRSLSALSLSYSKEPAGHLFHMFALKQAGMYCKSRD